MLKPEIVSGQSDESEGQEQISFEEIETEDNEGESADVTHSDLANQLEHNLAGLFLKMQSILHIPASSIQEIIQQFNQIHALSLPLLNKTISSVLMRCLPNADESLIAEVVNAFSESNFFSKCCDSLLVTGCLSTIKRRNSYVLAEFPLVMPVEYMIDRETKPVAYVPILSMLQKMLNKSDILDKALSIPESEPVMYSSYNDGHYFKNNSLLNSEEFRIALGFYVDDFEVANPLGTSRGKHKIVQFTGCWQTYL